MPPDQAPVRKRYRYLANRPGQFNYQAAIKADLPIGSGEVESAHRYVIQKLLKLPGLGGNQKTLKLRSIFALPVPTAAGIAIGMPSPLEQPSTNTLKSTPEASSLGNFSEPRV